MAYPDIVVAQGPRHYCRAGAASGSEPDLGSGAAAMAIFSATRDAASPFLGADDDGQLTFNGSSAYARWALSLQGATTITLSLIVTIVEYGTDDRMLVEYSANPNSNAGFNVDIGNSTSGEDNTISVSITGAGGSGRYRRTFSRDLLPLGEQHHLSLILSTSGAITVYVDGEQASTVLRDGGVPGGTFPDTDLYFASRAGSSLFCPCSLDEPNVCTRALSGSEIAAQALTAAAGPGILYVNADHDDATDELVPPFASLRAQALDPDHPLATIQAGVNSVISEDEITVVKATAIYAGFTATNEETTATDITISAADPDDPYSVERWTWVDRVRWVMTDPISDGTPGEPPRMYRSTACELRNWWAKQGGAEILHWTDGFLIHEPIIEAPWSSDHAGSYMNGAGFRLGSQYTLDSFNADDMLIVNPRMMNIGGEDGFNLAGLGNDSHTGTIRVEFPYFENVRQSVGSTAHTDCIASAGCDRLEVIGPWFGPNCESFVIASDGYINQFVMENAYCKGSVISGFSVQLSGVRDMRVVYSDFVDSRFGGFRIFNNNNPVENPVRLIANNIIDKFSIDDGSSHTSLEQFGNAILVGPRTAADLTRFPEFGTSEFTEHELANDGFTSPGIDAALPVDDAPATDRLGRARKGAAADIGCHESDPSVPVTPNARPPYLISTSPIGGAIDVAAGAVVTATLFPRPGEQVDAATVTATTFRVTDPGATVLPVAARTVGDLDEDGYQALTLDIDGDLYPYVTYTLSLTSGIEDTEGSALVATSASFRVDGPTGPAVYNGDRPATAWAIGYVT